MSTPPSLTLPTCARGAVVTVRSGELAALMTTPVTEAGVVVLVPGFTGSKEDFLPILEPLTQAGWRVCAIDLRGQHASGGPAAESAYTLQGWADDLADVVAGLGADRVHVVGHSFGGLVARRAVIAGMPVASLTLLCSGPAALPPERQGAIPQLMAVLPAMPLTMVWAAKEAMDRASGWTPPNDEVLAFLRERFIGTSPGCLRAMGGILMTAADETAALAETGVPIQVVYGEHDDAWPVPVQADMARRLGVAPVVIAGAAHSPAVEAPGELVARCADFWSQVSRASAAGMTAS